MAIATTERLTDAILQRDQPRTTDLFFQMVRREGHSLGEALGAVTVNAAHVLGRADRIGRLAPGYDADLVLLAAPDWRHLAYHVGGEVVSAVVRAGRLEWRR